MARSMQDGHCTDCIFKSKSTKLIAMICHDMSIAKGKSLRFEWEKKQVYHGLTQNVPSFWCLAHYRKPTGDLTSPSPWSPDDGEALEPGTDVVQEGTWCQNVGKWVHIFWEHAWTKGELIKMSNMSGAALKLTDFNTKNTVLTNYLVQKLQRIDQKKWWCKIWYFRHGGASQVCYGRFDRLIVD